MVFVILEQVICDLTFDIADEKMEQNIMDKVLDNFGFYTFEWARSSDDFGSHSNAIQSGGLFVCPRDLT